MFAKSLEQAQLMEGLDTNTQCSSVSNVTLSVTKQGAAL